MALVPYVIEQDVYKRQVDSGSFCIKGNQQSVQRLDLARKGALHHLRGKDCV